MLIESLIQPKLTKKPSRTVTMFGTDYEFIPVGKAYVAKVDNEEHAARFLANPKAFREFVEDGAPAATLSRKPAAAPTPTPAVDPAKAAATQTDGSQTADEVTAQAQALLGSTPTLIKKALEKNCPSRAVLEAALAIEKAEPAKKQRPMVIACLTGALSALDA